MKVERNERAVLHRDHRTPFLGGFAHKVIENLVLRFNILIMNQRLSHSSAAKFEIVFSNSTSPFATGTANTFRTFN